MLGVNDLTALVIDVALSMREARRKGTEGLFTKVVQPVS